MKRDAMKEALRKRRGRGFDISIVIAPGKEENEEKEEMPDNPKDGLSPGKPPKMPEKEVAKPQEESKEVMSENSDDKPNEKYYSDIISDGEDADTGRKMSSGSEPKSLRERMIMAAKNKLKK